MFFGIGEVLGVMTNPGEVLRSLAESRKLLEEARQEMKENSERAQIPTSHTFAPLPGFFHRPNEIQALERALGSLPNFTVLFGASSVGKTALCREVLSRPSYHCLHFDLRVAGFADLQSLYLSLSTQMESYFSSLPELMGEQWGWGVFEKESWAFKHDRIAIQKRIEAGGIVKTSDIAHLMELFQSALLKYWEFEPMSEAARKEKKEVMEKKLDTTSVETPQQRSHQVRTSHDSTEAAMREGSIGNSLEEGAEKKEEGLMEARTIKEEITENEEDEGEERPPSKKIPVFFLDEAHKLPALIQAEDAMKSILDSMLVLTKQDRLCHVIHATSDPFYMQWLRKLNIIQHCRILSIGDSSKAEAEQYFKKDLLPHVPEDLRRGLQFEEIYEVFGGKLAHLADYTNEYINSDGSLGVLQSSHFLQAYSLLNLQLVHSMPTKSGVIPGFRIHSPLHRSSALSDPGASPSEDGSDFGEEGFTHQDLLLVMKRLSAAPDSDLDRTAAVGYSYTSLPYFALCRELGVQSVDAMVRGRILELRWSDTVTREGPTTPPLINQREVTKVVGPVCVPTTKVVGYAMGVVVKEWEEVSGRKGSSDREK